MSMTPEEILKFIHKTGEDYYSVDHSSGSQSFYEYLAQRLSAQHAQDQSATLIIKGTEHTEEFAKDQKYYEEKIAGLCESLNKYDDVVKNLQKPDPGLREKMAKKYWLTDREFSAFTCEVEWKDASDQRRGKCYRWADQLLALFNAKEIRRQIIKEIEHSIEMIKDYGDTSYACIPIDKLKALKEEE